MSWLGNIGQRRNNMWLLIVISFQMYGAKSISTIDKFYNKTDCLASLQKVQSALTDEFNWTDDVRLRCVEE
jgi:hypothetical protein